MNDASNPTQTLADLLRHPEDLDKISALKADFTRRKTAIDTQLKLGLKEQLEITQNGMNSITDGTKLVNAIKEEMMKIDKLCAEAQNMIRDFPHINIVAQTHRNFELVQKMMSDIATFEQQISLVEQLLREDDQDLENLPNLLEVHYEISRLRDIKESALDQIKGSEDATLELINNLTLPTGQTLQGYFDRLQDVVDWFDEHVGTACMNLIPLVVSGNNGMVVRLALIIEEEEKKDKKAQAMQDAQKEFKDLASRFKSIGSGQKELRGYKEKFLKAIELYCANQIDAANETFLEDPDRLEKSVRWYFNDLNAVKLGMVTLTPKKWKIFQTYVSIYHKQMHDWLIARMDDPQLTPTHMLAIINWVEKYYSKMQKLGVDQQQLTPPLIDGRESDLLREYRQLIVRAVEEWMDRMQASDRQSFVSHAENMFDNDETGALRTKTLGDMWRMLREQLTVASSSERTDVVEGVVEAMIRALVSRQRMWEQLTDAELQKYSAPNADTSGLQALQDWLVAVANDQIACIDDENNESFLTRFSNEVQPHVTSAFASTLATQIETLRDGYVDLSTHCLSTFARLISVTDFKPILPELFTPSWYEKKHVEQMTVTYNDYLGDYLQILHPSLHDVLLEELTTELLIRYMSSVRNKGAKFRRADPFTEKIRDDVLTVFNFVGSFAVADDVKQRWRAVEFLVGLVESDKTSVPTVYERFKVVYWDANMGWVEACLRTRDDFDRSLLNSVKTKAAGVEVKRGDGTIMAKVK